MSRVRQDVLVDPPSASDTIGDPSDVVPWLGDYEEVSLIMEYQAYAAGDFTIYIQTLMRSDDGAGGYTDAWYDWSAVPIQSVFGTGYGSVKMPYYSTSSGGVIGSGLTPAWAGGDPLRGIPNGPIRAIPVSGSGITKSGAYCWMYFEGLKKKVK